ncbi:J domain-containing protein [Micropruina sp.]|uniref:J domain-containing protein n=1 Tax=Micropruina sp. TaxID=2737536 RepID=UPI0039E57CC6
MPTPDYYAMLHVAQDATAEQIRRNYIRLAKAFHPDTGDGDERVASEVTTAWNVLKDPARRAAYDATLQAEREAAQAPDPMVAEDQSFEDSWGTEAPWRPDPPTSPHQAAGQGQPPHHGGYGPAYPETPPPVRPTAPPVYPSATRRRVRRHYLRGESPTAIWVGVAWLAISIVPVIVGAVVVPSSTSTMVVPFALTVLSFQIGRRRILMSAMSGWYVTWVVLSAVFVLLAVPGAATAQGIQAWLTPSWLLGWLISYVWAVEVRRRDLYG